MIPNNTTVVINNKKLEDVESMSIDGSHEVSTFNPFRSLISSFYSLEPVPSYKLIVIKSKNVDTKIREEYSFNFTKFKTIKVRNGHLYYFFEDAILNSSDVYV